MSDGEGVVREHCDAASRGDFAAAGDAFDEGKRVARKAPGARSSDSAERGVTLWSRARTP